VSQKATVEGKLKESLTPPRILHQKLGRTNINSPEFPKGFQIKIKNLSSKPIYHISINVHLPDTEPFRLGDIWFPLQFGRPKLLQNSLRLEDLTQADLEEHPLTAIEPGKSAL
jgi:hypothetical protein